MIYDVVIIGGGPAGLTAAVYATRAGLNTVIVEKSSPGGKLVSTAEVENWPGIKKVTGPELAFQMFEHSLSFGAQYEYGNVLEIKDLGAIKQVVTDVKTIETKTVIVATGTVERKMNVMGEQKYSGKGVSYCAVCDGAFFKEKVITVVGGGNSALEEALYLTKFGRQVNIIIRRDVFRAEKHVQELVYNHPKINIITKKIPHEVVGENNIVTGLMVEDVETKAISLVETDAIFPFIGLDPATSFLQSLNILDDHGYIKVDAKMHTAIPGIYGAGDVIVKSLRQIVTATNDGAIAAQEAAHYIGEQLNG